jgi:hypothetical protein
VTVVMRLDSSIRVTRYRESVRQSRRQEHTLAHAGHSTPQGRCAAAARDARTPVPRGAQHPALGLPLRAVAKRVLQRRLTMRRRLGFAGRR